MFISSPCKEYAKRASTQSAGNNFVNLGALSVTELSVIELLDRMCFEC